MAEALRTTLRSRLTRVALAVALVASVLVVSVGTGYRASQAVLDDGSAWLVKGRTVAHVNAETGRTDAEVARDLAAGGERLEVVQTPSGHVFVVNDATGTVTSVDLTGMTPAATRKGTPGGIEVLGSGDDTYYVDRERGTVQLVDPRTMQVRRSLEIPAGISDAVAGPDGQVWVLDAEGTLSRIEGGAVASAIPTGGGDQRLSLVDGRPVLVDPGRGAVTTVDGEDVRDVGARLPTDARVEVSQPTTRGGIVWVADETSGTLVGIELESGSSTTIPLGSSEDADLGPAVTLGGLVYVPDYTAHVVRVVDAGDGRLVRTLHVVGTSRTFDLFVEDGRVWINDPAARTARVLDRQGDSTTVDKGSGHGAADPGDRPRATPQDAEDPPVSGTAGDTEVSSDTGSGQDRQGSTPDRAGPSPARGQRPSPGNQGGPGGSEPPPAEQVAVPDVRGLDRDAACAELAAAGLACSPQGIGSQPGVPPDAVVATSPAAAQRVPRGTVVTVQYAGATTVPDLTGRTAQEACDQLLTPAGLQCAPSSLGAATSPDRPVGQVVGQDPPPGQQVSGGSTVSYRFYDAVTFEDYAGQRPASVCDRLATWPVQCALDNRGKPPRGRQADIVIAQDRAAGSYPPGTRLVLSFFSGAEQGDPLPDVTGRATGQACAAVSAAGYRCDAREHPTPSRNVGVALSQSLGAGQTADLGSTVVVTQETNQASEVCIYRRSASEPTWVLRVGCDRSGVQSWQEVSRPGFAFAANQGQQGGAVQLFDNICDCYGRLNHMITPGGYNTDSPWTQNGTVGFAFDRDYGGMGELVRMRRSPGNGGNGDSDYAMAVRGSGAYQSYASLGFVDEQSLGWIWTS